MAEELTKEEVQALAKEFADALGETSEKPVHQISQLVEAMGGDFVKGYVDETLRIQEGDGLKTDDGSRKRTTGGVFFYLIKPKLPGEVRQRIFPNFGQKEKGVVIEWDKRHDYVDGLMDDGEHGEMRYVTITLQGRPGKVLVEDNSVVTTIEHFHQQTPFPRGVPHPPKTESTLYSVYMATKHWKDVEESLSKYKNDRLIVEGSVFYDSDTETVAVLATRVSTRRLEKMAKKAEVAAKADVPAQEDPAEEKQPEPKPVDTQEAKLQQLQNAAITLRDRITDMEEKGQRGVGMTKKLLANTEKQIESLQRQMAIESD